MKKKPVTITVTLTVSAKDAQHAENPAHVEACIKRGVLSQFAVAKVVSVKVEK